MTVPGTEAPVVDVAFDVGGTSLPADHAWPLLQAMEARLPWFADEARAGIHPLRAVPTSYGIVLLAQRAKLVLRVPQARLPRRAAAAGRRLDVGGSALRSARAMRDRCGRARRCPRSGWPPMPATSRVRGRSRASRCSGWSVACEFISGRRRRGDAGGREIAGFALTLHGLGSADSLRIQCEGMGGDRRLGWGIFVPAKSIAAVRE